MGSSSSKILVTISYTRDGDVEFSAIKDQNFLIKMSSDSNFHVLIYEQLVSEPSYKEGVIHYCDKKLRKGIDANKSVAISEIFTSLENLYQTLGKVSV